MPPEQAAFLLDILQSARAISQYASGYTLEQFVADERTQDAVLRRLLVIGEAAAHLTPETMSQFPEIPFRKMIGMRNRIVHDYGSVDLEIVWDTIQIHLLPSAKSSMQFFRISRHSPHRTCRAAGFRSLANFC
jgi:uncharacterized protein with HEPN domain